jgi:hypothetical protein
VKHTVPVNVESCDPVHWVVAYGDCALSVNERRIADPLSQAPDENFHQLGVILVRVFPNALAQFRARENTARCGGFTETKGNAVVTFYLFQCRNFRIPGVSIFRNL